MKKAKFSEKNLKISAAIPPEARKSLFWKRVLELLPTVREVFFLFWTSFFLFTRFFSCGLMRP